MGQSTPTARWTEAIDLADAERARLTLLTSDPASALLGLTPVTAAGIEPLADELRREAGDALRAAVDRVPESIPVTKILSQKPIREALMEQLRDGQLRPRGDGLTRPRRAAAPRCWAASATTRSTTPGAGADHPCRRGPRTRTGSPGDRSRSDAARLRRRRRPTARHQPGAPRQIACSRRQRGPTSRSNSASSVAARVVGTARCGPPRAGRSCSTARPASRSARTGRSAAIGARRRGRPRPPGPSAVQVRGAARRPARPAPSAPAGRGRARPGRRGSRAGGRTAPRRR